MAHTSTNATLPTNHTTVHSSPHMQPTSYGFDHFKNEDQRQEALRLKSQATVLLHREISKLQAHGLASGLRAIEIGCGPAFVTGAIANMTAPAEAVGIDLSADLLAIAHAAVAPHHHNLTLLEGNAYALPFDDASFDFAYSRLVYQHLSKPLVALQEARRILRPGGRLVVMDIDDDWLTLTPHSDAFEQIKQRAAQGQSSNGGDRHIARKLPNLMRQAGFQSAQLDVQLVTSLDLGINTFLDITTRFKSVQIGAEQGPALLQALNNEIALLQNPFGMVGAFFAVGIA